jgi:hypothetical protein
VADAGSPDPLAFSADIPAGRTPVGDLASELLAATRAVWANGQDDWTLMSRKLVNRDLWRQVEAEPYRVGGLGALTLAADVGVGAQATSRLENLTRYHGFFVLDGYAELRLAKSIAVNFNLEALNPSASDGYRYSSQLIPGLALVIHHDLLELAGSPLTVHFVAPDLDLVTVGRGLLLEETPLEGFAVGVEWQKLELRTFFGGRAFWGDDDFLATTLSWAGGALGLSWVRWLTETVRSPVEYVGGQATLQGEVLPQYGRTLIADYLTVHGAVTLGERLRLSGEYGLLLKRSPRQGLLARADWLVLSGWGGAALHLGYQLRWYQRGLGPRETLVTPSTSPNLPYRENSYVTNSFEYLALTPYYEQWSHTLVGEVELPATEWLVAFGQGELWYRSLSSSDQHVLYVQRFGRAPGYDTELFYRAGLRVLPWVSRPHRLSAFVTNKLVASGELARQADPRRFVSSTVLALQVEVFL